MHYKHSIDKAKAFNEQTLAKLNALGVPPNPSMYALWYAYVSGENAGLAHAADMLEKKNKGAGLSYEDCQSLYDDYLDETRRTAQVHIAGEQVQTTIEDVNHIVRDVKGSTAAYGGKLTDLTTKLGDDSYSPEDIQGFLKEASADTQAILSTNNKLEVELGRQAEMMVALQRELHNVQREVLTDALTNVANRRAFDEKMTSLVENNEDFCLVFMDIDHFKNFNDQYGHQVGDHVLRLVARTLIDGVRDVDFVARYGGEEFAVVLPSTKTEDAYKVAEKLRRGVEAKEILNRNTGKSLGRITLSGGVSSYCDDDCPESIIQRADDALYEAKQNGRNAIHMAAGEAAQEKKA